MGWWRWRWRRLGVEIELRQIPTPRIKYANEGPGFHFLALTFGTRSSDPIIGIEIDLRP